MDKSLFLARRRLQEESALDPSASPDRIDDIASVFGGKATGIQRPASDKKISMTLFKEESETERVEPTHIPEHLANRLAARRQVVDKELGEKAERVMENIQKFPRGRNESAQLTEVNLILPFTISHTTMLSLFVIYRHDEETWRFLTPRVSAGFVQISLGPKGAVRQNQSLSIGRSGQTDKTHPQSTSQGQKVIILRMMILPLHMHSIVRLRTCMRRMQTRR
jgi:hypothetical protein